MTTLRTLDAMTPGTMPTTLDAMVAAPARAVARRPRTAPVMSSTRAWCGVPHAAYALDTDTTAKAIVAFAGHGSRRLEEHST